MGVCDDSSYCTPRPRPHSRTCKQNEEILPPSFDHLVGAQRIMEALYTPAQDTTLGSRGARSSSGFSPGWAETAGLPTDFEATITSARTFFYAASVTLLAWEHR
jgi:hypothetical protein